MKERSLVFFTLLMQASVGVCVGLSILDWSNSALSFTAYRPLGWIISFMLAFIGLTSSFLHLKVPLHAWRGVTNLKTSWLSREILFATIYTGILLIILVLMLTSVTSGIAYVAKLLAFFAGLIMIYCMGSAYLLKTVKYWNSPQTIFSFYTSTCVLGILLCGSLTYIFGGSENSLHLISRAGAILSILIIINIIFSFNGYIRLISGSNDQYAYIRKLLIVRICLGISGAIISILLFFVNEPIVMLGVIIFSLLSEFYGRVLFYEAQVPYGVYLFKG